MDDKYSDYLAETLPEDERLENLRALSAGLHASVNYFLGRVGRYHELLELELEDSPGGERYLKESSVSLGKALRTLDSFSAVTRYADGELESFDLGLLAKGMAQRIGHYRHTDIKLDLSHLDHDEAFIRGKLFLFQQLIFDLPRLLVDPDNDQPGPLALSVTLGKIDDAFFVNRKSNLKGGDYCTLTIARGETVPKADEIVHLNEWIVGAENLEITDRLLFVYGVTMGHGGDLFTGSRQGSGLASLSLIIPAQRNRVAMYTDADVGENEYKGTETILLVDDEAIIWDVVIDMLQGMGYTVILAADGRDCVDIYKENPGQIDLVLLDMVMPEMNGKDAFFALREIDPKVKVLLQSGYIQEDDARDVLDAGAKGFLRKPYRMRELAKRIREILST